MVRVVKQISLTATFSLLKVGDSVEIEYCDATENNVRTAASRYSKDSGVELKVTAPLGAEAIKVTRIS